MNALPPQERVSSAFRAPPANLDAEKALLGAIMSNNRHLEKVSEFLRPQHFAGAVNGRIYEAILRLNDVGGQASFITLNTYLGGDDLLQRAGGSKYLAETLAAIITTVNVAEYGRIIRDLYLRRRFIEMGEELMNRAYILGDESAEVMLEKHEAALTTLSAGAKLAKEESFDEAAGMALEEWRLADLGQEGGVHCGLESLVDVMGKMQSGDLIFIAGNTSMGKTALATTIAVNAARAGNKTVFFTIEMKSQQLASRIMTGLTGIPGPRQRRWKLTDKEWIKLMDARSEYSKLPLTIRYAPGLSLAALRSACRRMKRNGLDLVVVDYLQIMGRSSNERYENRVREISELTMGLKTLAGEIEVPIIVLSQLSRDNWKRDNPRPLLSDLRDSGSIEQDADTVIFCFREEYFLERNRPVQRESESKEKWVERLGAHDARLEASRGKAEAIVAKHRHGQANTAFLAFENKRAWFLDPPDYKPDYTNVRDPSAPMQTTMEI